ncbi:MAG: hypothetical protein S4CHLAM37_05970 [Chlamydiia bacterium]|nr:hypothetical protein [Chlamydiia bacterium]
MNAALFHNIRLTCFIKVKGTIMQEIYLDRKLRIQRVCMRTIKRGYKVSATSFGLESILP